MRPPLEARHASLPLPSGIVPLLALTPLVAVADSMLEALGLGIAAVGVLAIVRGISVLIGSRLPADVRLGVAAVLVAATVAVLDRVTAAFLPDVHASLAGNLPLVAAASLALASGLSFVRDAQAPNAPADRLRIACMGMVVLVALGAAREYLGPMSQLATRPAGAFLLLGLGLAAFNAWHVRRASLVGADAGSRKEAQS
jgi:Na+-translocating ferredoxin:NAD+ oxidoreductase RnfE subunit